MISPRCICGHRKALHVGSECLRKKSGLCSCSGYIPKRSLRSRVSGPKRASRPRKQRKGKRASLARECDRLWSLIVRHSLGGRSCISGSSHLLQAAHGFSRKYRATRWLPINGFPLTAGEHWRYTNDPLAWDEFLREQWGQPVYDELRRVALKNEKQDMPAVLSALRAEAERLGIER